MFADFTEHLWMVHLYTFTGTQKYSKAVPGLNCILTVSSFFHKNMLNSMMLNGFLKRLMPLCKFPGSSVTVIS